MSKEEGLPVPGIVDMTTDEKESSPSPSPPSLREVAPKWRGSEVDRHDMLVMGGRPQQLRRNFQGLVTIMSFGCILISTWELNITTYALSLTNGGTAGMIYGFIFCTAGYGFVYASLAEMASMSPTAGGQYHWVSEFSPPYCQKYLSYLSGWLCFIGWQGSISAIGFLIGTVIQTLILLHYPDSYIPKPWHGTLIVIILITTCFAFNFFFNQYIPIVEGVILIVHVAGFFGLAIPLLVMSSRLNLLRSAYEVFTGFNSNGGGWPSTGMSFMVGLLPVSVSLVGMDCIVHMAEEVKDSSRTLPRALMVAHPLNAALGLFMILILCFCTPVNTEEVLASPAGMAGYPYIQIIYNATGKNLAATTVMAAIPLISLVGCLVAEVSTASRQLWSFARDGGVPFSRWVATVNTRWELPLNAIMISLILNCLLSLVNISSTAALNALLSLSGGLLTSYILCIGSLVLKRLRGDNLPARRWSLGGKHKRSNTIGLFVNIAALLFLSVVFTFSFFPPTTPVVPITSMNWGILLYGFMIILSTGFYLAHGRKVYTPPVFRVRRDL